MRHIRDHEVVTFKTDTTLKSIGRYATVTMQNGANLTVGWPECSGVDGKVGFKSKIFMKNPSGVAKANFGGKTGNKFNITVDGPGSCEMGDNMTTYHGKDNTTTLGVEASMTGAANVDGNFVAYGYVDRKVRVTSSGKSDFHFEGGKHQSVHTETLGDVFDRGVKEVRQAQPHDHNPGHGFTQQFGDRLRHTAPSNARFQQNNNGGTAYQADQMVLGNLPPGWPNNFGQTVPSTATFSNFTTGGGHSHVGNSMHVPGGVPRFGRNFDDVQFASQSLNMGGQRINNDTMSDETRNTLAAVGLFVGGNNGVTTLDVPRPRQSSARRSGERRSRPQSQQPRTSSERPQIPNRGDYNSDAEYQTALARWGSSMDSWSNQPEHSPPAQSIEMQELLKYETEMTERDQTYEQQFIDIKMVPPPSAKCAISLEVAQVPVALKCGNNRKIY